MFFTLATRHGLLCLKLAADGGQYLLIGWESNPTLLGDELAVYPDTELVLIAFDQLGLNPEFALEEVRHTGSLWWEEDSDDTIPYLDTLHGANLLNGYLDHNRSIPAARSFRKSQNSPAGPTRADLQ